MGDVITMFSAARWVDRWEAMGGMIILGEGSWGTDGKVVLCMCELMPQLDRRDLCQRDVIAALRRQVSDVEARSAVIDHLARRAATRGRGQPAISKEKTMNVPSFLTDVENAPAHTVLTRGFGNVLVATFQDENGKLTIDVYRKIAALIDSLGSVLAMMPVSETEDGRRALMDTVLGDLFKVMAITHAQPEHLFAGTTMQ